MRINKEVQPYSAALKQWRLEREALKGDGYFGK